MKLEEAIKHAEEVAENKYGLADEYHTDEGVYLEEETKCRMCAEEHEQLAMWLKDYKRLLEQEPCENAISRQAVLEQTYEWSKDEFLRVTNPFDYLRKRINALLPVTPAEKVGRWIEKDGYDGDTYYDCSECGGSWTTIDGTPWNNGMKYCPDCGARMEVL